jgi:hypothetical protein
MKPKSAAPNNALSPEEPDKQSRSIVLLSKWLHEVHELAQKEELRLWQEKNNVYGFHGGISDDEENDRRYRELDLEYERKASYRKTIRGVLLKIDELATHHFTPYGEGVAPKERNDSSSNASKNL